ncbi:ABC transporter substrate-binding protein [Lacticaseibacillus baoqingensis]|uniref:ABC transporter substrate-binding protein n=1 Tax=Lacticaseibacillus baoqingensis TaxID=2486013 RepID=A0ABW4E9V5_9LACO|nr:ABC transporter substrate-binding protein [Lacticaseibacillus baoqingensis]
MKKSIMKRIAALGAVAAAFTVLAGCAQSAASKGNTASGSTIKLGVNIELSGVGGGYGEQVNNGINLAVSQINKDGGVKVGKKTYKFKTVTQDNKTATSTAASIAAQLTSKEKVSALIGPATTNAATAALSNATKASVAQVSPSATAADYTLQKSGKVQPYAFRTAFTDDFQGTKAANFVDDTLKAKKVAVLADNSNDYGKGLAAAFKKEYKGTVVATQYFQSGDKDFNAVLTSLKNKGFDALYIPGYYTEIGLIIKQARQMGINTPIVGGDGMMDPSLTKIAGAKNVTNVYYTTPFSTLSAKSDKTVANFLDAYKAKYGDTASAFNALGFDSVYLIKQAIVDAKSTNSVDIAKALAKVKDLKGVTGTMTIDSKHNPEKTISVEKLVNGKAVSATTVK